MYVHSQPMWLTQVLKSHVPFNTFYSSKCFDTIMCTLIQLYCTIALLLYVLYISCAVIYISKVRVPAVSGAIKHSVSPNAPYMSVYMSRLHSATPTPSFCGFWHGHQYIFLHFLYTGLYPFSLCYVLARIQQTNQ